MADEHLTPLQRYAVEFFVEYKRPPSLAELILAHEAMASVELDRDETHVVEGYEDDNGR